MKDPIKYSFLIIFVSVMSIALYGQNNSVGINILTPNPNAVLELVSPNNNQGLLIPRLTTAQRNALTNLKSSEQGLLVYDITVQSLFWWNGSTWNTITGKNYTAGTGITIDATNVISGFDGNYNNLINKPTNTTYTAGTGISINTSNNIANTLPDQVVELIGTGSTIVSGIYPKFTVNSSDKQDLILTGTTLSLTGDATIVELSAINTDAQDLTISGNTFSLTGDATNVDLSATIPTDQQVLTWNGTTSKWEAKDKGLITYTAGTGITIDALNTINSLWTTAAGSDVVLSNSMSNVGIGSAPLAGYKLFVNGKLQTAGINELSDKRWKTDINPIENSLDKVKQLQGVTYKWNIKNFPDKNFEKGTQMGLIAQEVEKVLPYIVDTDVNGYKSVEYSHLVALLVEAIKEQQILIKQQQSEIQSLNSSNTDISNKYKSLETKLEKQQTQIDLLLKYMESSNTVQQSK